MIFLTCASITIQRQFVQSNDGLQAHFYYIKKRIHFTVHDVVEELASGCILHDDEDILLCFDDLVHLSDGRVLGNFKDMQLSRNTLNISDVFDLSFFQDLYCHWFASDFMHAQFHFAEGAAP